MKAKGRRGRRSKRQVSRAVVDVEGREEVGAGREKWFYRPTVGSSDVHVKWRYCKERVGDW